MLATLPPKRRQRVKIWHSSNVRSQGIAASIYLNAGSIALETKKPQSMADQLLDVIQAPTMMDREILNQRNSCQSECQKTKNERINYALANRPVLTM